MFSQNAVAQLWYFVKCIYFALSAYQIRCGYPTRILGNFLTKKYNHLNLFLFQGCVWPAWGAGLGVGGIIPSALLMVPHLGQVPAGAVPGGAAGSDGLGVDGHHAVPVQLDVRGGHLRQHLHHQVQPRD